MDRPEGVTKAGAAEPAAEQSASMQRGETFADDGIWAGFGVFPVAQRPAGTTMGLRHYGVPSLTIEGAPWSS